MNLQKHLPVLIGSVGLWLLLSVPVRGQEPDAAVAEAALAGNNAWMLTSSALVLFMTAPGLAMFYSGLVRRKNVLGVMMQCLFLMGLLTIVWAIWGYSLAFGGDNPWFGNGEYLFLNNIKMAGGSAPLNGKIPALTHMVLTRLLVCSSRRYLLFYRCYFLVCLANE
jgi:Amt family ammonium transporter